MTASSCSANSPIELAPGLFRSARPTVADLASFSPPLKTIVDLEQSVNQAEAKAAMACGTLIIQVPMSRIRLPQQRRVELAAFHMEHAMRPLLVHCTAGMDRTGLVVAYWRVRYQGWLPPVAWQECLAIGFHRVIYSLRLPKIHSLLQQAAGSAGRVGLG
jgi:tyrosine-protein phosphatase SIW14